MGSNEQQFTISFNIWHFFWRGQFHCALPRTIPSVCLWRRAANANSATLHCFYLLFAIYFCQQERQSNEPIRWGPWRHVLIWQAKQQRQWHVQHWGGKKKGKKVVASEMKASVRPLELSVGLTAAIDTEEAEKKEEHQWPCIRSVISLEKFLKDSDESQGVFCSGLYAATDTHWRTSMQWWVNQYIETNWLFNFLSVHPVTCKDNLCNSCNVQVFGFPSLFFSSFIWLVLSSLPVVTQHWCIERHWSVQARL